MFKRYMRPLFVKLLTLVALLGCLFFFISSKPRSQEASIPKVTIKPQPDSPLTISGVKVDVTSHDEPLINFHTTNVSYKAVRAYAILKTQNIEESQTGEIQLNHMTTLGSMLYPTHSKADMSPADESNVVLSIDFVEFADGTTWGDDTFKSKERLAGQRAGARAAKEHLLRALKEGGPEAVLDAISSVVVPRPPNQSEQWTAGFSVGVDVIRNRIQTAHAKGGLTVIADEVRQPYDASEGRP